MSPKVWTVSSTAFLIAACGGAAAPPPATTTAGPAQAETAPPPVDTAKAEKESLVRSNARRINGAAVEWASGHAGTCPTLKDVLGRYGFPAGTEVDASGTPFTIECTDGEMRVVGSGHEVLDRQAYSRNTRYVPVPIPDESAGSPGPAAAIGRGANAPIASLESVIRSQLFPAAKRCYQRGLANDPDQAGTISVHLEPADKCHYSAKLKSDGISSTVLKCIGGAIEGVDFCDAPGTALVPMTFTLPR
jgi:hypothetical protein